MDHYQACQVFVSSSYWQERRRKESLAHQQKRPIFQQHKDSDAEDGQLVYKHKRRYYYLATYFMNSVTLAIILFHASAIMSGYSLTTDGMFDEPTKYIFLPISLFLGPILYLSVYSLLSRTIVYIYYSESKHHFRGVCYNWLMMHKNVLFKPGEVQLISENAGAVQFFRGCYIINKKRYHISAMDFISTRYYNLMLGFINS